MLDVIQITPPMRLTISALATWRRNTNLASRDTHHYYDVAEVESDGLTVELAFARWLGVYPQNIFGTAPDSGLDYLINGWRIDVKATKHTDGGLIALKHKQVTTIDIYVLGIVDTHTVRFAGWEYAAEVLRGDNYRNTHYTSEHYIDQSKLYPMAELRRVLREGKPK